MITTKTKKPSTRLAKALKKNFDHWLDWSYYGHKTTYDRYNPDTNAVETVTEPLPKNNKRSLNFWLKKDAQTGRDKRAIVFDLMRMFRKDEVGYEELVFFCNDLSQKAIKAHFAHDDTVYYVNSPFAKVVNLLVDWDDKLRVHLDTQQAAEWLDKTHFMGQSFIQDSTSATGTHQYIYVLVDGVDVMAQKNLYARLIPLLRLEAKDAGFRCAADLDRIKGVGHVISWHKSKAKRHAEKPHYYQIETCGIFGKLPRLSSPEDERRWLDRKIIPWSHLVGLVERLEAKHHSREEDETRTIGGSVTEAVSFDEIESNLPPQTQRKLVSAKLTDMLGSDDKQRVALASVFMFENAHGRRPTEADFSSLNSIYNQSTTATDSLLTPKRRERFAKALKYSEGRPSIRKSLIAPATLQTACEAFQRYDLMEINAKLIRAKQKVVTPFEVGRVWSYFIHNYNSKLGTAEEGRVSWNSLLGLATSDTEFDVKRFPKMSRNAITACLRAFVDWGLIEVLKVHDQMTHDCAKYTLRKTP